MVPTHGCRWGEWNWSSGLGPTKHLPSRFLSHPYRTRNVQYTLFHYCTKVIVHVAHCGSCRGRVSQTNSHVFLPPPWGLHDRSGHGSAGVILYIDYRGVDLPSVATIVPTLHMVPYSCDPCHVSIYPPRDRREDHEYSLGMTQSGNPPESGGLPI